MKKPFGLLLATILMSLSACTPSTNAEAVTIKGQGTLTWHHNVTFVCVADVTIKQDLIENVVILDNSFVHTGSDVFDLWDEHKDEYLNQYIGKNVYDIADMVVNDPKDVNDHYDGGSISSDVIEIIAGASASSSVVAKAVKNAAMKYIEGK